MDCRRTGTLGQASTQEHSDGPCLPPATRRILDLIAATPGVTKSELCRFLDRAWGTVDHHVHTLLATDQIHAHRVGRSTHLFPAGTPQTRVVWTLALRSPGAAAALDALRDGPCSATALAERVGHPARKLRPTLARLVEAGALQEHGGRRTLFSRSPVLDAWSSNFGFLPA